MRTRFVVLLWVLFGSLSLAHADVIFSGSVSTTTTGGSPCGASGGGANYLSLSCSGSDPTTTATVSASGDAFGGSVGIDVAVLANSLPGSPQGTAMSSAQTNLVETYVLTGGAGPATIEFALTDTSPALGTRTCEFTFDGVSQSCDGGGTFVESVDYLVPFSIGFDLDISSVAENGEPAGQSVEYGLSSDSGSIEVLTPEPSSILLLMPGIAGVLFAVRSRGRRRTARAA